MTRAWLVLVLPFLACSGGADDRHPAMPDTSSNGGRPAHAGTASTSDGGDEPSTEGGHGGAPDSAGGEGGGIIYDEGTVPEEIPGVCDAMLELGREQTEDLGLEDVTLLSVTADELSVAFFTGSGLGAQLFVADRSSASAALGEPQAVPIPTGYEVGSGASLSANGLELILVKSDHSGFGSLSRSKRGGAFDAEPSTERFTAINAQKPMSGRSLGWPVLTSDGKTLYFLSYFGQGLVVQSKLQGDAFDLGTEIDEFTLGGQEGMYKLPTGIASDERAIFVFDQATGHSQAFFRSRPGAPFYDPLDLGERRAAMPNTDCSRVYSSVDGILIAQPVE